MTNLRTLNKLLKEKKVTNKEATRFKGEYYLLHILRNNTPVPLFHSKEAQEVENYINLII